MNKLWRKYIWLVLIALLVTCGAVNFAVADVQSITVTVLATSDLHGRIYPYDYATDSVDNSAGIAKLQSLVLQEKAKNQNIILLDCGDTVQDNLAELFNDAPVHPMVKALNFMKYDAWTLGNHEFNFGLDFLAKNIKGFTGKTLAANIYKQDGARFVNPYIIVEKSGVRVAIIGLITPHIPTWEVATPDHFKGLIFTDPVVEAEKTVAELKGKYDVLIGAFHMGDIPEYGKTDGAIPVAEACPEFSVIFCGHKHARFDDLVHNGVKLIEPGSYGAALAKAELTLEKVDGQWQLKEVATTNLSSQDVPADPAILKEFQYVHRVSLQETNKVVGEVMNDFIKRPDYITGNAKITTMPTAQLEDTAVIDLINEVQMYYAGAEISAAALFNFGSNLKKGPFKKKDVAYIYKYTNTLMGVSITGENLKKYMEWSAAYYNQFQDGDVTISFNPEIRGYNYDMFSGVNYEIDLAKPANSRIVNLTFQGKPVEDTRLYKLAVNNYRFGTLLKLGLVKPEDKYFDSYVKYQDAGRVRDLIIKYVQEVKKGKLVPDVDNNWKIVGATLDHPYREVILEMVGKGVISIPTSTDGRTLNVKAINVNELIAAGKLKLVKYTVKTRDRLGEIATRFNTTIEKLIHWNSLKSTDSIVAGQELVVGFEY